VVRARHRVVLPALIIVVPLRLALALAPRLVQGPVSVLVLLPVPLPALFLVLRPASPLPQVLFNHRPPRPVVFRQFRDAVRTDW
jgi:hypothetical protein